MDALARHRPQDDGWRLTAAVTKTHDANGEPFYTINHHPPTSRNSFLPINPLLRPPNNTLTHSTRLGRIDQFSHSGISEPTRIEVDRRAGPLDQPDQPYVQHIALAA